MLLGCNGKLQKETGEPTVFERKNIDLGLVMVDTYNSDTELSCSISYRKPRQLRTNREITTEMLLCVCVYDGEKSTCNATS